MKRRDFIHQSALAGTVMALQPSWLPPKHKRMTGVQLYSVRDVAEPDPIGTLKKLSDLGFTHVEGYKYDNGLFFGMSVKDFKTALRDHGIQIISSHTDVSKNVRDDKGQLTDDMKRRIDDHASLGMQHLINPSLPGNLLTLEDVKRICDDWNLMGEACKKAGLTFGHHNHDTEFHFVNEEPIMELILRHTDPALFSWQMDMYWVAYANEDIKKWIQQHGARIFSFHVKDMAVTPLRETIEVGDGGIDFVSCFMMPEIKHVTHYIIELEHYRTSSMEGVGKSLQYLDKLFSRLP